MGTIYKTHLQVLCENVPKKIMALIYNGLANKNLAPDVWGKAKEDKIKIDDFIFLKQEWKRKSKTFELSYREIEKDIFDLAHFAIKEARSKNS